ncbi:MAG: ankyrin repeat domain-containing protein [Spirochaetes bacterium]|uniref:Ankyrin repeat domain-containing protein n=1 Tax=Candidatus Ornithospirochaeta stercoripullorum TaxID=2840899 RepID=A0A9D9E1V7_9SPIO|nr:ankyrin repeat domain-containing protein [Candidatus Ornithospirochaeta stercoripullorum]
MKRTKIIILSLLLVLAAASLCADALVDAIEDGQTRRALELIEQGADIYRVQDGYTSLQIAILNEQEDVALALIDKGVNVNAKGDHSSPLYYAVSKSMTKTVFSLLDHNAAITATEIKVAIQNNLDSVSALLIEKIPQLNIYETVKVTNYSFSDDCTILEGSINRNLPLTAEAILEKGADPDFHKYYDQTPLYVALEKGIERIALLLIENGADVNYYYQTQEGVETVLYLAINGNMKDIAIALIDRGADVKEKAPNGISLAELAYQKKMDDVCALMIEKGAVLRTSVSALIKEGLLESAYAKFSLSVDAIKNANSDALVQAFIEKGDMDRVEELLSDGIAEDKEGLLFYAIDKNSSALLTMLIAAGADVNAKDEDGSSVINTSLREAPTLAKLLIENGADPNSADSDGYTPIGVVIDEKNLSMIPLLSEAGADINAICTPDGLTPLTAVVSEEDIEAVKIIIANGADPNTADRNGNTPLAYAVESLDEAVIDVILESGGDLSSVPDEALPYVVYNEHADLARKLISAVSDINATDDDGDTALYCAVLNDDAELVSDLLEAGSNPNAGEGDSVHLAIENGYDDILALLLDSGADVNTLKDGEVTPLTLALLLRKESSALLLIEKGADVNKCGWMQLSPISIAITNEMYNVADVLIDYGAECSSLLLCKLLDKEESDLVIKVLDKGLNADEDHSALLSLAIRNSEEDIASKLIADGVEAKGLSLIYAIKNRMDSTAIALIENGTDPELTDEYGNTPLYYAIRNGMENVSVALIEAGADPNAGSDSSNLMFAIRIGMERVALALIAAGADVNYEEYDSGNFKSIMCYAAESSSPIIIKALYEYGAEPDYVLSDSYANVPLYYAICADNLDGVEALAEIGAELNSMQVWKNCAYIAVQEWASPEMIKLLSSLGCSFDVTSASGGMTPLVYAVSSACPLSVIQAVLDTEVNVNVRDDNGKSALVYAAENSSSDVITALLDAGADPYVADNSGRSVFDYIRQNENAVGTEAYMRILRSYRPDFKPVEIDDYATLIISNGTIELNGVLYSALDWAEVSIDGMKSLEYLPRTRRGVIVKKQKHTIHVLYEDKDFNQFEYTSEFYIPSNETQIVLNLPALVAGLGADEYVTGGNYTIGQKSSLGTGEYAQTRENLVPLEFGDLAGDF